MALLVAACLTFINPKRLSSDRLPTTSRRFQRHIHARILPLLAWTIFVLQLTSMSAQRNNLEWNRWNWNIDSTFEVWHDQNSPMVERLDAIDDLSWVYRYYEFSDTALTMARQQLALSREVGNKKYEVKAYARFYDVYMQLGMLDSALWSVEERLRICTSYDPGPSVLARGV